ncbi:MAG: PVC-type heme-binding CxxCH protein [Chthoniobacteraceae bacterium]
MRPLLFPLLASLALAADNPNPPGFVVQPGSGLPPADTARAMKLPDGFSVQVFAGEPDLVQPIAFTIDDRGRLWVLENLSYPEWKPEGNDRIVILEDTDGDGRFDSRKVFHDKINMGSGIEVGFGGVWVGTPPNLLFIADKNGDDVPDGEPEIVLDGWEHQDMHETLNSFNWGPDGWLYGTHGVFTFSNVGKPGAPDSERTKLNAGVWRLHPLTRKFEVFAHGTSNPWGVDFNDYGQAFITACVIPHLYHIAQGGLYQRQAGKHYNENSYDDIKTIALHRHWATGEKPTYMADSRTGSSSTDAAGGGHAHCGALVYLGEQFPAEYRGSILMNNIHGNRMNNDSLAPKGSGWVGDRRPDFMKSQDKWYRGLGIRQAPDGSVYVADWYDSRACHQQRPHDRTNGRIYKITYGKAVPWKGDVAKMSDAELVKLQTSKNEWLVRHARRVLQERGKDVSAPLKAQLANTKLDTPQRLRALWALHALKVTDASLLANKDAWIRAWTIQLLCENGTPSAAVLDQFATLADSDPSPVVRLYLAAACQRLPLDARFPIVQGLLAHGEDAEDQNLPLMYWYAAEPIVGAHTDKAALLLGTCAIPKVQEFIARRLATTAK